MENIADLQQGMVLEGVVTNVTDFGAFIDIGVHQDGLAHISAMSDKFIKHPREVVKTGDLVKVKVMDVDSSRKRISLSMRMDDAPGADNKPKRQKKASAQTKARPRAKPKPGKQTSAGSMADAFAAALRKK